MMRILVVFGVWLGLMSGLVMGQTRKIGHRSHSGSPSTFALNWEEEHLGEVREMRPPVTYEVEPFIVKVRKYYEKVASEQPAPVQSAQGDSSTAQPIAPKGSGTPGPTRPPKNSKQHSPEAALPQAVIPSPAFLVQTQLRPEGGAAAVKQATTGSSNWLWWMLVAPAAFLAAAVASRRKPPLTTVHPS